MFVQETAPGKFEPIGEIGNIIVRRDGLRAVCWPTFIVKHWNEQQLATIGVYPVEPFAVPVGAQVIGTARYERKSDGKVYQVYNVEIVRVNEISHRQLVLGLYHLQLITAEQAHAAIVVGASPPPFVANFLDKLPPTSRAQGLLTWASATVQRNDSIITIVQHEAGLSDERVDQYFREFSQL